MRFLLMLCDEEARQLKPGDPGFEAMMARYAAFQDAAAKAGAVAAAGRLRPTHEARTVRVRNGKAQVLDGPFADTKEQLGGFYLLDCADLDAALALAAQLPTAERGCVEVRPLF